MRRRFLTLLFSLISLTNAGPASAADIFASGSGWCINLKWCNGSGTSQVANYFVGSFEPHQNWFSFDLPAISFLSASLNIWNVNSVTFSDGSIYSLYEIQDVIRGTDPDDGSLIDFRDGDLITQISLSGVSEGYFNIPLDAAAIAALNNGGGQRFIFGGVIDNGALFGNTQGTPVTFLRFEETSTPGVPEPATWMMFLLGFFGLGHFMRRRKLARHDKHAPTA